MFCLGIRREEGLYDTIFFDISCTMKHALAWMVSSLFFRRYYFHRSGQALEYEL